MSGPLFNWPFKGLSVGHYGGILCDPPWSFSNFSAKGEAKNAKAHYDCMSVADLKALPVADLAAPDCYLFMWATNPMLDKAFEVMVAWGFTYVTAGTWLKQTKHGNRHFGTGYVRRSENEPYLIGKRGKPSPGSRSIRSAIIAPFREHSRKPDQMRREVEQTCHKSQGSQWDSVIVFDEGACFRDDAWRWRYTAVTRAAKRLTMVLS